MYNETNSIVTTVTSDNNIRLKLTSKCQWSCHFCHMEGLHGSPDLIWNKENAESIKNLAQKFNRERIHLTGGEPTTYTKIIEVISFFKSNGFNVSITSNGQFDLELLKAMHNAGLKEFTFSFPTLNWNEFVQMNAKRVSYERAVQTINNLKSNIDWLRNNNIPVDINLAFTEKIKDRDSVFNYCIEKKLNINILDIIGDITESRMRIKDFLSEQNFKIERKLIVKGTSRAKFIFKSKSPEQRIVVRYFEPAYLNSMCLNCDYKRTCEEKYYGIRVEMASTGLMVRTCIHKQTLTEINKFALSPIGTEILNIN